MLGINLLFAGFALTLNGISYIKPVDDKAKGISNAIVALIIAINAVFQISQAYNHIAFGFGAAMWLFAVSYFLVAIHILFKSTNWGAVGLYGLFAGLVSIAFAIDIIVAGGPWEMAYMWSMWSVLWLQSFFAISLNLNAINKVTPHVLILNGIASTFVPGILVLLGIIL